MRNSLDFCSWQDRKAVAEQLKEIYRAATPEAAAAKLEEFTADKWGSKYSTIAAIWRRAWEQVIPFFAYPPEIRKVIYTTNAIESLNMQVRKVIKNRGHFSNDEAATKLIYLALQNLTQKWTKPVVGWKAAMNQFAIQYGDRIFFGSAR